MKKFLLFALFLSIAYFCADRYINPADLLGYAKAHPRSYGSEPLEYYVGFLCYARGDYAQAQKAFIQLLEDFPKSDYDEKALFYVSDSAQANMDYDTERTALEQYEQEFPDGANIRAMRKRLDLLNYEHPVHP